MPALPAPFVNTDSLLPRDVNATVNATSHALQVICAWPVSGQYGAGSRILYYALIIACVVAHQYPVIRDPCTSAALLLPALAAFHSITLAALHRDGAVDLDIYGAFQICSIGILTCTLMVRRSGTYFNAPGGRHIVYLWTGLVLAGLLSLAVEFYRIKTTSCTYDQSVGTISNNPRLFPFNDNPNPTFCGILCNQNAPPKSPMRGGAQDNIYVIPAPSIFTFGQAMLFSVACCIPAILSLVAFFYQIKEFDWRNSKKEKTSDSRTATIINADTTTEEFMKRVDIPVFSCVILAILIIGEINFWSVQIRWQTEPFGTVGQWSPIVGTILVIAASAYIWWVGKPPKSETSEEVKDEEPTVNPLTEDLSPDNPETQNIKAPRTNSGIDFEDDETFRAGPATSYPGIPAEPQTNPHYRKHVDRYAIARQGPSRDPSPYSQNHSRASSEGDNEATRSPTTPTSPSNGLPQRRPTLEVPQIVHSGRGRSSSVVSTSSQPGDDLGISVKSEKG